MDPDSDLNLFGENFDAIMDILDEDDELEEDFIMAVDEVEHVDSLVCEVCAKKCKSKGGLKRHKTAKHPGIVAGNDATSKPSFELESVFLRNAVEAAKSKISENMIYATYIREDLSAYNYLEINEESTEFITIADLIRSFPKKNDLDKFYRRYYSCIPHSASNCFPGLSQHVATLLSIKLADQLLFQVKGTSSDPAISMAVQPALSVRETAGLQYIGGYVFHKLHLKHRSGKNWKSLESQCTMQVLRQGKLDDDNLENNQLTNSLSRGGLWGINQYAEEIFLTAEMNFREFCPKSVLKNINANAIIAKTMQDSVVRAAYDKLLSNLDVVPENSLLEDILYSIVSLYVKVRCFSFARDIIQKFKIDAKKAKSRSLRVKIKRASDTVDES